MGSQSNILPESMVIIVTTPLIEEYPLRCQLPSHEMAVFTITSFTSGKKFLRISTHASDSFFSYRVGICGNYTNNFIIIVIGHVH